MVTLNEITSFSLILYGARTLRLEFGCENKEENIVITKKKKKIMSDISIRKVVLALKKVQ